MSRVVGIDLGTTNSLVAVRRDGATTVIPDESGDRLLPSVVSIGESGAIHVGREAQRRLLSDAARSVYSVKRFMGRGIEDARGEEQWLPFKLGGDPGSVIRVRLGERTFTPPEISSFILRELKRRAEAFFAREGDIDPEVSAAVITVPAYFNDAQRTATRDAGRLAGLEVLRIVNEPTAACLAYGLDRRRQGVVAVYDLGGGTFDISILRIEDGVFQVLATNGNTHLGGDDFDRLLVEMVARDTGIDPAAAPEAVQAIRKAVIQAKLDLSEFEETRIEIDSLPGRAGPYSRRLTRDEFEAIIGPVVARTLEPCRKALADAGLDPGQVDEAVLVGGSTRVPLVRREVERLFGRAPHTDLNPDEVVAIGAAVQADILVSGRREMLLLDVTPLSLGIETMGGVVSKIILRNSTIPASGGEMFTTFVDNQTAVDIHILQGEREMASDNRSLGRFKLRGIPPMPAGLPRIQVRFQIDANGILSVSARELRTGIAQTIEVKPSYGLTDEEVERMLIESFEHAQEDVEARMLIDARNEAETIIAATEKALRRPEFGAIAAADLDPKELVLIHAALADLKQSMGGGDRYAIQVKAAALNQVTRHLAEVMMNRTVQAALAGRAAADVAAEGR
ncbi:MAG TPA: Fe-S protein assembly chaperone HscA [Vicinamibacterales bacterium]|nr:Fe-S protein assembly chaperone HscA [Vicinamibacterales bacterium]HPW19309.1 Fe-S protein assembly chaperone HscA [Vicinamibacterales bacterium]